MVRYLCFQKYYFLGSGYNYYKVKQGHYKRVLAKTEVSFKRCSLNIEDGRTVGANNVTQVKGVFTIRNNATIT